MKAEKGGRGLDESISVKIFIVVLNWNLKEDTVSCVESILSSNFRNFQIVIVDNGSSDGSIEAFRENFSDRVDLIANNKNCGFACGMNVGIRYSLAQGADWIMLLNNDVILDSDMLSNLVDEATSPSNAAAILGPAIYHYAEPGKIWKLGDIHIAWFPIPIAVKNLRRYRKCLASQQSFEVDYVTGCAMFIRREVFKEIGLFDERYFMYFEDADFCARAGESRIKISCVPAARLFHKISLTASRDKPFNRYHRMLNQVRFYYEHTYGYQLLIVQVYLIYKFVTTLLVDLLNGDFDLVFPSFKALLLGHLEQFQRLIQP